AAQNILQPFALGRIHTGADYTNRIAIVVNIRCSSRGNPADSSVRRADAAVKLSAPAFQTAASKLLTEPLAVIRIKRPHPVVQIQRRRRRNAVEPEPFAGAPQPVRVDLPFEQTDSGGFLSALVPLLL